MSRRSPFKPFIEPAVGSGFDDDTPTMVRPVLGSDLEKCRGGARLIELDGEPGAQLLELDTEDLDLSGPPPAKRD